VITANIIHRVFRIRFKDQLGTGFTISVDGREYLVTAKHIVKAIKQQDQIDVFGNEEWTSLPVRLVGHGAGEVDITVLAPNVILTPPELPVQATSNGMAYGQELFFLGYPYNLLGNVILTDQGYPLPFVKRAIFSCFDKNIYYLDGHNNRGFSGGPVVFDPQRGTPTSIAAVISGYMSVAEQIYGNIEQELTYQYNTGIIVSYKIELALSLIYSNPIGLQLA
jgi:hypothetical protein